mmetsp:Transcript_7640/g.15958  ORF Transcript_7640/g.15958 Transcript_7640/m.15958 type:complete len:588 (+) Transcript_7640:81-1844(+)
MAGAGAGPALPAGLTKEITRHPSSLQKLPPQPGDEVEVHYVAKIKVTDLQFDSSRDRGKAFKYKVGQGEVIQGWELGVQTMRKGEHARFTIAPALAYGEAGDGDRVPPNSVVVLEIELISCPVREDLFEDGGAIKREVKEGREGRQPRSGDECQITCKVTVEDYGVAIASEHFVYRIGSEQMGQLAKVIDRALSSMKRGDEVLLTCQPSYAFGQQGKYAGKAATISLTLEEIYEVHDTSLGELDKTVLRKRIKEGTGNVRIHDTARVKLQVKSVTANSEKVLAEKREFSFVVGNGEVCDALEGSVLSLREGEEAILKCVAPEACSGGLLGLPEGLEVPVMIDIVVVSFEKALEKWDLDSSDRIKRGRERKEVAAELFKRGRTRLAAHHYEAIAGLYQSIGFFKAEEQKDALDLRRVSLLNRAMCMLKMGNMKSAKSLCTEVLKEDAANPKALFRRAKASVALREYPEAIVDLNRLLEVEPSSADGRSLLREAKRLQKREDGKESVTFARMCAGLGQLPERSDRREDDVVVMPDLEQEYAKIAQKHGLPMPSVAAGPATAVAEAEAEEDPEAMATEPEQLPAAAEATS